VVWRGVCECILGPKTLTKRRSIELAGMAKAEFEHRRMPAHAGGVGATARKSPFAGDAVAAVDDNSLGNTRIPAAISAISPIARRCAWNSPP
jgi:hypothetical protein